MNRLFVAFLLAASLSPAFAEPAKTDDPHTVATEAVARALVVNGESKIAGEQATVDVLACK
jgi:hypothetical protein